MTERHLLSDSRKRPDTAPAETRTALHPVYLPIRSTSPRSSPPGTPQPSIQRGQRSLRWDLEGPLTPVQVCFRFHLAYTSKQRHVRHVLCLIGFLFVSVLYLTLLCTSDRKWRRSVHAVPPVHSIHRLSSIDVDRFSYFFPYDHLSSADPAFPGASWPTPSGLTSSKALELCHSALFNSTLGSACRGLVGRRMEDAVDLCILDLQIKDDLEWERELLPFLENECERRWLEGRASLVGVSEGLMEVETVLRCPDLCNGRGSCMEWGCQCDSGHSHYDCSLTISECLLHIKYSLLPNAGF